jgi:hypothetical protein
MITNIHAVFETQGEARICFRSLDGGHYAHHHHVRPKTDIVLPHFLIIAQ